jgi:hypothetical protein
MGIVCISIEMAEQFQQQILELLGCEPQTEAIGRQVAFLERQLNALNNQGNSF